MDEESVQVLRSNVPTATSVSITADGGGGGEGSLDGAAKMTHILGLGLGCRKHSLMEITTLEPSDDKVVP